MMTSLHEHHQQLEEKVNELASSVLKRFDDLAKDLGKQLSYSDKLQTTSCEGYQKRVEEKFDTFMDKVLQKIDLQGDVGTAVTQRLTRTRRRLMRSKKGEQT